MGEKWNKVTIIKCIIKLIRCNKIKIKFLTINSKLVIVLKIVTYQNNFRTKVIYLKKKPSFLAVTNQLTRKLNLKVTHIFPNETEHLCSCLEVAWSHPMNLKTLTFHLKIIECSPTKTKMMKLSNLPNK